MKGKTKSNKPSSDRWRLSRPKLAIGRRGVRRTQSILIPAAFATALHFLKSDAISLANSSLVPGFVSAPIFFRLACTSGDASPSLIADRSVFMIAGGVPAGATAAVQFRSTMSGNPASAIVGRSGNSGVRVLLVIASAFSFPLRMRPIDAERSVKAICTCPLMTANANSPPPR